VNLTVRTTSLELARPLRISRSAMSRRDAVRVCVGDTDGPAAVNGYGEVVSSVHLKITAAQAAGALRRYAAPALARHGGPESALAELDAGTLLPDAFPPGVTAAVGAALLDLLGKQTGRPVHRLLRDGHGGHDGSGAPDAAPPPAAATARTIGITGPEDAAAQARALARRGFALLKIKAGTADPAADLDRVAAVRDAAGPGVRLLLDPNGAWTPEQATALLPRFAALGVEAVEQPTAPGDPDALVRLAERSPLPLIADEDAAGYEDALRLAGRIPGINIKLAQCGGVHRALRICAALAGSGTEVMLGCQASSSLSIAPAVHLVDRARWVDLDGHLLLAHDPWQGIGGSDGTVRTSGRPGLGVTPAVPVRRTGEAAR
jgi:L-alanine-DL-glutamate epimerase-like enolase superfamily enzyme